MALAPVVQRLDNAIHRINHYPADSVVCFFDTYPLDSDLSGGQCYPAFEQPGPGLILGQVIAFCSWARHLTSSHPDSLHHVYYIYRASDRSQKKK